eukprot:scaffold16968_cov94-Amphora_coffeaeformis.AAC.1
MLPLPPYPLPYHWPTSRAISGTPPTSYRLPHHRQPPTVTLLPPTSLRPPPTANLITTNLIPPTSLPPTSLPPTSYRLPPSAPSVIAAMLSQPDADPITSSFLRQHPHLTGLDWFCPPFSPPPPLDHFPRHFRHTTTSA